MRAGTRRVQSASVRPEARRFGGYSTSSVPANRAVNAYFAGGKTRLLCRRQDLIVQHRFFIQRRHVSIGLQR